MVKRCVVKGCQSNYCLSKAKHIKLKTKNDLKKEPLQKIPKFTLPSDEEERNRWIHSIPYLTRDKVNLSKETPVVCARHWPEKYPTVKNKANGKSRPSIPPSIFENVPYSSLPTPLPPPLLMLLFYLSFLYLPVTMFRIVDVAVLP